MTVVVYFAYGSNMDFKRLKERGISYQFIDSRNDLIDALFWSWKLDWITGNKGSHRLGHSNFFDL